MVDYVGIMLDNGTHNHTGINVMKLSHLVPLTENASALVMPTTVQANAAVIDAMEAGGYITEDESDFVITVDLPTQFVYVCKNHMDQQYMVGSWDKKTNDFGNHPFEGNLYDCVAFFNKKFGTQFQIKH